MWQLCNSHSSFRDAKRAEVAVIGVTSACFCCCWPVSPEPRTTQRTFRRHFLIKFSHPVRLALIPKSTEKETETQLNSSSGTPLQGLIIQRSGWARPGVGEGGVRASWDAGYTQAQSHVEDAHSQRSLCGLGWLNQAGAWGLQNLSRRI